MEILTPCPARVIHPSLNPPGFKSRNEEHRVQLWFKVLSGEFAPLANGGKQTQTNKPRLLWHSSKRLECLWWGSSLQVVGSVGPGPARVGAAAMRFGLFPFTIPLDTKDRGKKKRKKRQWRGARWSWRGSFPPPAREQGEGRASAPGYCPNHAGMWSKSRRHLQPSPTELE